MALNARSVGSAAASGVAAATSRVGSGGRNVASTSRTGVEKLDYSQQMALSEEALLKFQQQDGQLNPDGSRKRDPRDFMTPLQSKAAFAYSAEAADEANSDQTPKLFLTDVLRGVGSYEENMRVTSPGAVKPGSVMNYLF